MKNYCRFLYINKVGLSYTKWNNKMFVIFRTGSLFSRVQNLWVLICNLENRLGVRNMTSIFKYLCQIFLRNHRAIPYFVINNVSSSAIAIIPKTCCIYYIPSCTANLLLIHNKINRFIARKIKAPFFIYIFVI